MISCPWGLFFKVNRLSSVVQGQLYKLCCPSLVFPTQISGLICPWSIVRALSLQSQLSELSCPSLVVRLICPESVVQARLYEVSRQGLVVSALLFGLSFTYWNMRANLPVVIFRAQCARIRLSGLSCPRSVVLVQLIKLSCPSSFARLNQMSKQKYSGNLPGLRLSWLNYCRLNFPALLSEFSYSQPVVLATVTYKEQRPRWWRTGAPWRGCGGEWSRVGSGSPGYTSSLSVESEWKSGGGRASSRYLKACTILEKVSTPVSLKPIKKARYDLQHINSRERL